jgi:hypothetical protein
LIGIGIGIGIGEGTPGNVPAIVPIARTHCLRPHPSLGRRFATPLAEI